MQNRHCGKNKRPAQEKPGVELGFLLGVLGCKDLKTDCNSIKGRQSVAGGRGQFKLEFERGHAMACAENGAIKAFVRTTGNFHNSRFQKLISRLRSCNERVLSLGFNASSRKRPRSSELLKDSTLRRTVF